MFATALPLREFSFGWFLMSAVACTVQPFSCYGTTEGELLLSPNMEFLVTKEQHTPSDGPLLGCNVIEIQQIPDDTLWS